ncbi:MAG: SsrA-binding protein [bacterium]
MEIRNRSAFHEYFIEDKYDAGMVLTGTEVKALRSGKASFNDSFCTIDREEVWLRNLHISEYEFGSYANDTPMREG